MTRLIKTSLKIDSNTGIWYLPNSDYSYSDGTQEEAYLRTILHEAKNTMDGALELSQKIKDWTSEYHLSPARSRILSAFKHNSKLTVLEIGCGCGAITRFLAENYAHVISIEGSRERIEIARLRTKDLENITFICAPFDELKFNQKFDLVFSIGVLEYMTHKKQESEAIFDEPGNSITSSLHNIFRLISKQGTLVVAIENQFGLKYFSGAQEDHSGRYFEGVEGYPLSAGNAVTFGKQQLKNKLSEHGFSHIQFFYPFPDYKLPELIISNSFLTTKKINAGELVSQFNSRSYGKKHLKLFREKLTWWELGKNQLINQFANSFLVLASRSNQSMLALPKWQAVLWSTGYRKPEYQVKTIITPPHVTKKASGIGTTNGKLKFNPQSSKWKHGPSLALRWFQKITQQETTIASFIKMIAPWANLLQLSLPINPDLLIPGKLLDLMPWNIVITDHGFEIIDQEWEWTEPLSANYIVMRGLYQFFNRYNLSISRLFNLQFATLQELLTFIGTQLFTQFSESIFEELLENESLFHHYVSGQSKDEIYKINHLMLTAKRK